MSAEPIPDSVVIGNHRVRSGSLVRLRPSHRSDVFDLALHGQTAVVDAVEEDLDGRVHLAVILTDDPGRDLSARIGQRFFFGADEVEPLDGGSETPPSRVLVAGIGNVFFGDDGFGVAVVQAMRQRDVPGYVDLVDFGIRGMDLVYALGNGYRTVILVDAARRGQEPGTVSLVEPDLDDQVAVLDTHHMDPVNALRQANQSGPLPESVLLLACEPSGPSGEDPDVVMELSPPVATAVGEAVEMLLDLLGELIEQQNKGGDQG